MISNRAGLIFVLVLMPVFAQAAELLLIDGYIHYSHDAWE